jgi:hypothetical protein
MRFVRAAGDLRGLRPLGLPPPLRGDRGGFTLSSIERVTELVVVGRMVGRVSDMLVLGERAESAGAGNVALSSGGSASWSRVCGARDCRVDEPAAVGLVPRSLALPRRWLVAAVAGASRPLVLSGVMMSPPAVRGGRYGRYDRAVGAPAAWEIATIAVRTASFSEGRALTNAEHLFNYQ